ncbi:MAG: heme ABC exporter ATP-binding protein CcmA [Gammaproteobacteria bacterium]
MQSACLYRDDTPIFIDIDFSIDDGQQALIKGANGSGKTSLIRSICGFTELSEGHIKWNQLSIDDIDSSFQNEIAYLGHKHGLINEISAIENISMNPNVTDLTDLKDLVSGFNLDSVMDKPVEILSSGQAKKTALIGLILSKRSVWIMDEPFANLDLASIEYLTHRMDLHIQSKGMIIRTSNQDDLSESPRLAIVLES